MTTLPVDIFIYLISNTLERKKNMESWNDYIAIKTSCKILLSECNKRNLDCYSVNVGGNIYYFRNGYLFRDNSKPHIVSINGKEWNDKCNGLSYYITYHGRFWFNRRGKMSVWF